MERYCFKCGKVSNTTPYQPCPHCESIKFTRLSNRIGRDIAKMMKNAEEKETERLQDNQIYELERMQENKELR
jgi:predicted  nucleic acid-binding Zn-ribbon protein